MNLNDTYASYATYPPPSYTSVYLDNYLYSSHNIYYYMPKHPKMVYITIKGAYYIILVYTGLDYLTPFKNLKISIYPITNYCYIGVVSYRVYTI